MGNLNGYVAVGKDNALFGKSYSEQILLDKEPVFNGNYMGLLSHSLDESKDNLWSIDMAINVHGGITYSANSLYGIEDGLLGELWWFGFDTAHAGDLKPFQNDIDRKYQHYYDEYRDFEYVKKETISLAEQLSKFKIK